MVGAGARVEITGTVEAADLDEITVRTDDDRLVRGIRFAALNDIPYGVIGVRLRFSAVLYPGSNDDPRLEYLSPGFPDVIELPHLPLGTRLVRPAKPTTLGTPQVSGTLVHAKVGGFRVEGDDGITRRLTRDWLRESALDGEPASEPKD